MGDAGSAPKLASEEARLAREAASIKKAEDKKAKEAARGRERWAKKKLLAKEFKFKPLLPPNYRAGRIGVPKVDLGALVDLCLFMGIAPPTWLLRHSGFRQTSNVTGFRVWHRLPPTIHEQVHS